MLPLLLVFRLKYCMRNFFKTQNIPYYNNIMSNKKKKLNVNYYLPYVFFIYNFKIVACCKISFSHIQIYTYLKIFNIILILIFYVILCLISCITYKLIKIAYLFVPLFILLLKYIVSVS